MKAVERAGLRDAMYRKNGAMGGVRTLRGIGSRLAPWRRWAKPFRNDEAGTYGLSVAPKAFKR